MTTPNAPQTTVDPALKALVTAAEEQAFRTAVTLVTTGAVISGVLIGRTAWIHDFVEQADTGEGSDDVRKALVDALLDEDTILDFLHLEAATIHEGAISMAPTRGTLLWRGRIADVVGWNISTP